jgi:hypothetical protein
MSIKIKTLLPLAAALALGACTGGYGSYGISTGYGVADPYYGDGLGYGSGVIPGYDYGYGYGPGVGYGGLGGWYNDFYYPGTGVYVIDRSGRRQRWNDSQRRYWEGRWNQGRPQAGRPGSGWQGGNRSEGVRPGSGWQGGGRPEGIRPGYVRPDRGGRPDAEQPGIQRPDRGQTRPGGWNGQRGQDGSYQGQRPPRQPGMNQGGGPRPGFGQGGRGDGGPRFGGGQRGGGQRGGGAPMKAPQPQQ